MKVPRKYFRTYDLPVVREAFEAFLRDRCSATKVEWLVRFESNDEEHPSATYSYEKWETHRWRACAGAG